MIAPAILRHSRAELERERCLRTDQRGAEFGFPLFARLAWPLVEPARRVDNWHLDAIAEHLQAAALGQIRKLLINVAPRSAKSTTGCVLLPAWIWAVDPSARWMFGSYALDLALRDSRKCRRLLDSEWYQERFVRGAWSIQEAEDRAGDYSTTKHGNRFCLSVGSKGLGFGGRGYLIDDPNDAKDRHSRAALDAAITWRRETLSTRFDDPARSVEIIMMQRLAGRDLSGAVLDEGGFEFLCLPAEFDSARRSVTYIRRPETGEREEFWRDPRKEDGELLDPVRLPAEVLEEQKKKLGSAYGAMYRQRPVITDEAIFPRAAWRFWRRRGAPPVVNRPAGCWDGPAAEIDPDELATGCLSVDCAFKAAADSDFVVMLPVAAMKADRFVLDRSRGRRTFTATLGELARMVARWPKLRARLVEDKANGTAVIDTMAREIAGLIPINPKESKEARAHACSPEQQSGNVFLPDGAPWLEEFIAEHEEFPGGNHDDQVDALTQALNWLAGRDLRRVRALVRR